MKTALHEERLFDIFFKGVMRHREQEEMQNAEKELWGGLLIKRARMCERRQPSIGEKMEVRRWDEKDD